MLLDNVKCIDGSPAGYYVDSTSSSKWVFWLEGGGACFTEADCQKRAKSVYKFLVKLGVPKTKLVYKGYGEDRPIMDNDSDEGRAANRRVEFVILKQSTDSARGAEPPAVAPAFPTGGAKPKCDDLVIDSAKNCCTRCGGRWAPEPLAPVDPMNSCLMDKPTGTNCLVTCISAAPVPTNCE